VAELPHSVIVTKRSAAAYVVVSLPSLSSVLSAETLRSKRLPYGFRTGIHVQAIVDLPYMKPNRIEAHVQERRTALITMSFGEQLKAMAGNITPGDTPGFPVTISQPGSYRLDSNLTVPDVNTTAILITANNVTLDLNGFSIIGSTQCMYYIHAGNVKIFVTGCNTTGTGVGVLGGAVGDFVRHKGYERYN
jgi:hypothetical protein